MTLRRKSREFALQMLFEWDMTQRRAEARGEEFLGQAQGGGVHTEIR